MGLARAVFLLSTLICAAALAVASRATTTDTVTGLTADQITILRAGVSSSMMFHARKEAAMAEAAALTVSRNFTAGNTPYGVYGVDFSAATSTAQMTCMRNFGMQFVIPRGYRSAGVVDSNLLSNIATAQKAGVKYIDVYYFPRPHATTAQSQLAALVNALNRVSGGFKGMVWVDVEGVAYWGKDYARNQAYFVSILRAASALGVHAGVYTSRTQWLEVFGTTAFAPAASYPLWYAHYDGRATFADFVAFGGWSQPKMKQFRGDTRVQTCTAPVDINLW
jgi:GH25 family lysozyme M1 (1,4-beta-N-acetylmuramidase)